MLRLVCFLSFFSLLIGPAFSDTVKLKICYETTAQPPYFNGKGTTVPPKGERGLVVEAFDEDATSLDIEVQWVRYPWKRCLAAFENGEVTGIMPTAVRGPIQKVGRFPQNEDGSVDKGRMLAPVFYHFYENTRKPIGWKGKNTKFEKRLKIASPRGYIITQRLKDEGIHIVESLTPLEGLTALLEGAIDAYVFTSQGAGKLIERLPKGKEIIKRLDPHIWETGLYTAIRKEVYDKNPDIIDQYWKLNNESMRQILPASLWAKLDQDDGR